MNIIKIGCENVTYCKNGFFKASSCERTHVISLKDQKLLRRRWKAPGFDTILMFGDTLFKCSGCFANIDFLIFSYMNTSLDIELNKTLFLSLLPTLSSQRSGVKLPTKARKLLTQQRRLFLSNSSIHSWGHYCQNTHTLRPRRCCHE